MIQLSDLANQLKSFNKDLTLRALRERYSAPSFFEMMSISRKENQHSAFIKWLLQGDDITVSNKYSPLMGLLDILLERAEQQGKCFYPNEKHSILKNAILTRSLKLSNITAKCERSVGQLNVITNSKDRLDIHIVCDVSGIEGIEQLEFIIENKVGSKEGDEKLRDIKPAKNKELDDIEKYL